MEARYTAGHLQRSFFDEFLAVQKAILPHVPSRLRSNVDAMERRPDPERLLAMLRSGGRNASVGNLSKVLLGLSLLAVAVWLAIPKGPRVTELAKESASWPQTTAKVLRAEVDTIRPERDEHLLQAVYVPDVLYSYQVDGREYTQSRYRFGVHRWYSIEEPQALVDDLKKRGTVVVHYRPSDPSQAVIIPGYSAEAVATGVGTFWAILAVPLIMGFVLVGWGVAGWLSWE